MCAALYAKRAGLNPVILEKQDKIGGSTGFSGGVWWVPNNHVMKRQGVHDSTEEAHRYFESVVDYQGKGTSPARRSAFIDYAPQMLRFLEEEGMEYYYPDGWADYYDDLPGGNSRGRSLMAKTYDSNRLGPWRDKLSLYAPFAALPIHSFIGMQIMMFRKSWKARRTLVKAGAGMILDKVRGRKVVASGGAIQGRMLEMALRRQIPIFTGFATDRLIEEDGRVVGVEGIFDGKRTTVRGPLGVLLNTGGFARNEKMREKYQRKPTSVHWTNANPGETGEMLEEAIRIGADTENLDTAVWVPTSLNPDLSMPAGAIAKDGTAYPFMHNADIGAPHFMMVDKYGKRYVNEANSYMDLGEKMYQHEGAIPTFAIFDDRHMRWYPWGSLMPGTKPIKEWLASGFLVKADTIAELAQKAGIDPAGLSAQVERFNGFARTGVDKEFNKGGRQYDRFRGDPTVKPNPCLGEISQAPYYAIRMFPADVGTFGGVVTDEHGRVMREDDSIIEGLYAAGNCTSSVMGRTYPGAGASISPSFTFGYLAVKNMIDKSGNSRPR
jgi:3-oxosteroid 1-dehydrogenase